MSLPIIRDGRIYSDVLVDLYSDGQIRYDRESLLERLAPFIAETARMEFEARLGPGSRISPEQVERAGVLLRYDSSLLEIHVERIDPLIAPLKQLGEAPGPAGPAITLQPASLSAYLNVSGDFRVSDFRDFEDPALLLTGAMRYGGVVLEFDGGYDPSFGRSGFYRRETRLVYDEPEHSRRWSAGDLQLPGLSVGGGALLGGVGVEKGRRNFLGAQPLTSIGSQQVLLERDATVEVFVAGQQVQTLQLAAGPYDLSQLRAEYSGRNAQLFITDITGRRQLTDFDTYFNPIDLAVGEDEYSAGLGFAPRGFSTQPAYGGLPAFSGHYRRGLTNRLSLGAALQVSERIQMTGLEVVTAPRAIPGRFELSGAVSNGDGLGFAAHGGYTLQAGSGGNHQVSIVADYRSDRFATLVDEIGVPRMRTLNVSANYSRGFGDRTILVAGLNWFAREHFPTIRSAYADVIYRTSRFRLTGGVEYGTGTFGRTFGARVAITVPFGRTSRAEVGYNSRRNDFRTFMSRSSDDRVGSWGYDLGVRRTPGSATVDASGTYVGDRFFSRAVVSSGGTGFSDIGDRQQARLQVGTALAYADGAVAIGRPIQDSFVIASPSPSLEGERAVIGRSLGDNQHDATSGTLGPALAGRLTSYSRQSIVYDLAGGARGRDIGSGVETIEPPYRSGYRLIVGKGATITAAGFLNLPTGRAELVSGTITSSDDPEFGTQPFFTNSAGRFAVMGLKPGHSYQVRLFNHDWSYSMTVPERTDSLLQLGEILVVPAKDPKE
jgi:outer membrane usher protein